MANQWLRLYSEIIDDEKIRMLAFEDRWHYIALLCCKSSGVIDNDPDIEFLNRRLGVKLGLQKIELENLQKRLIEVRLIDENWQPLAWDKRQFKSDSSTERTRTYREKLKNNINETSQKRHSDRAEADTEAEADINIFTNVNISKKSDDFSHEEIEKVKKEKIPYQEIVNLYHERLPELAQVYKLTAQRKTRIKNIWLDELDSIEYWGNYFSHISKSKFLMGKSPPGINGRIFIADFDFLINPTNYVKIAEDKYHEPRKIQRR